MSILLGLLQLALAFFPGAETLPVDRLSSLMGFVAYGLLGVAFIWIGGGSVLKRRWAPPLMLILAWTWLLGGLIALLLVPGLVGGVLAGFDAQGLADGFARVVTFFSVGMAAIFGVLLPALFVAVYSDRNLRMTCQANDPTPDWTARCPVPVLGLSVGLGAFALLTLPLMLRPAVPLFGILVTGWPGASLMLLGAAACGWLARETYRLRRAGWWGTLLLLLLVGLSTLITFQRVEPIELYRELGYPQELIEVLGRSMAFGRAAVSWGTAVLTLLSLAYMATVRKHFRFGGADRSDQVQANPVADGRGSSGLSGSPDTGRRAL